MWGPTLVFQVSHSVIDKFSILNLVGPVDLTIELHAGIKEFYQLHQWTESNAFHIVRDQTLIHFKKVKKKIRDG